jgi:hypothetical protein
MAGNGVSSMTQNHDWLPPMLALSGTWDKIVSDLYGIFEKDFKQGKPKFQHYMVWWDQRVLSGQRFEEGFWHLITRDDKDTGERIPDFRRAERLPWCAPVIINSDDSSINVWDYQESRRQIRTYVWLTDKDYCVILERLRRHTQAVAMLVTAFHVDGPSQRRSLRVKLEKKFS